MQNAGKILASVPRNMACPPPKISNSVPAKYREQQHKVSLKRETPYTTSESYQAAPTEKPVKLVQKLLSDFQVLNYSR